MQKNIKHMFILMFALFVVMAGYFVHVAAVQAAGFVANPFNARVHVGNPAIRRGSIYDAHGEVVVESVLTDGVYTRQYPFGAVFAHVGGFSAHSNSGLELARNFEMYRLNWELAQRFRRAAFGDELEGNSVVTTLDAHLQSLLYNGLAGGRGAAVAIRPQTGEVLAMVSTPGFDPNTIAADWGILSADTLNSPLLNRAASGLYPPGSTFKIVTALAALNYDPNLINFTIDCQGRAIFGENALQCAFAAEHGVVDMTRAMAVSCNIYFATLAQEIGAAQLIATARQLGFNNPIAFELMASTPQFPMSYNTSLSELIETSFGQGRILTTPLHMAILISALANEGMAMHPYIVNRIITPSGGTVSQNLPRQKGQIIPPGDTAIISEMLREAVIIGTGRPAYLPNLPIAGKTGTAENAGGIDHSWFMGFAPVDNPQIAIAVIIEGTGGGPRATLLARDGFVEFLLDPGR